MRKGQQTPVFSTLSKLLLPEAGLGRDKARCLPVRFLIPYDTKNILRRHQKLTVDPACTLPIIHSDPYSRADLLFTPQQRHGLAMSDLGYPRRFDPCAVPHIKQPLKITGRDGNHAHHTPRIIVPGCGAGTGNSSHSAIGWSWLRLRWFYRRSQPVQTKRNNGYACNDLSGTDAATRCRATTRTVARCTARFCIQRR